MSDAAGAAARASGTGAGAPTDSYVLAIDVGTSSVRAMLFDGAGNAVPHAIGQQQYPQLKSEEGEIAVDADVLVAATVEVIDTALANAGPLAQRIVAVATDTFWHSLVAVDAAGKPLTPVITWADTRPRGAAGELRAVLDEAAVHRRTGAMLHASYWPAKLRWLRETSPEVFRSAVEYLSFGEYLHRQLLGKSVCSLCMASGTGLLLTKQQTWDADLLRVLEVNEDQLPTLGDLGDTVRGLAPRYAGRWPALRSVPWFPALGDGATANVGSGCATPTRFALTVGTTSAVRTIVPLDGTAPAPGLWLYLLDAKRGVLGGALSEGGNIFAWLESTMRLPSLAEAESDIAALPPDGHGLVVLPYLVGERSLGWHGEARATIAGLSVKTSPNDVLRAAIEALAYRIGAVYQRLVESVGLANHPPQLIGSGGSLLGSRLFQQVVADVLQVPLYPSSEHEASARGAALLALESLGALDDVARIAPSPTEPVRPDPATAAAYQRGRERQEHLYSLLLGQ